MLNLKVESKVNKDWKHSRKDSSKRKSNDKAPRGEVKYKERKDRNGIGRKSSSSERFNKDSRVSGEDTVSSKLKKGDGPSRILTERERGQFSNEIVESDLEDSSSEEDIVQGNCGLTSNKLQQNLFYRAIDKVDELNNILKVPKNSMVEHAEI